MEHKRTKKKDGAGLYIAICCCILVIALIGYANNLAQKNEEEERFLAEQAGENVIVPEVEETPLPIITPKPEVAEETTTPETENVAKNQQAEEAAFFTNPVSGKVLGEFSDKQIFYESIEEWRTHNGLDIEAQVGDSVSAAADGVVSRVFMGSLGYSVQIDHNDGLTTVYSNLDENPTVAIGDNVKQGDVVGHVGTSALADLCDEAHLHFEVLKDGKYENPLDYLN